MNGTLQVLRDLIRDEFVRGGPPMVVAGRVLAHLDTALRATPEPTTNQLPVAPKLVASPEQAPLVAALEQVESRHRRGDWTEEGWHANSIDGIQCNGCREDWPCSAQRLRLLILSAAVPATAAPAREGE